MRGVVSMFEGIEGPRLLAMLPQERRWLDNLKKAFHESDSAYVDGRAEDDAYPAMVKAIDVAAKLRRSLQIPAANWQPPSTGNNKAHFVAFLHTEIPSPDNGGLALQLIDARTGMITSYGYAELMYAIRCMIHENENLNADEQPGYHVVLDWSMPREHFGGELCDGRITLNAQMFWWRLREVLAKFVLGMEMMMAFSRGDTHLGIHGDPPLKSVHPADGGHLHAVVGKLVYPMRKRGLHA